MAKLQDDPNAEVLWQSGQRILVAVTTFVDPPVPRIGRLILIANFGDMYGLFNDYSFGSISVIADRFYFLHFTFTTTVGKGIHTTSKLRGIGTSSFSCLNSHASNWPTFGEKIA
jgi:hypothetical protein